MDKVDFESLLPTYLHFYFFYTANKKVKKVKVIQTSAVFFISLFTVRKNDFPFTKYVYTAATEKYTAFSEFHHAEHLVQ